MTSGRNCIMVATDSTLEHPTARKETCIVSDVQYRSIISNLDWSHADSVPALGRNATHLLVVDPQTSSEQMVKVSSRTNERRKQREQNFKDLQFLE